MTSTSTRRPCVATHLGCTCTDQTTHVAWVDANTKKVRGTELRDGDTVYLAGIWRPVSNVTVEGDTLRLDVEAGRTSGNARSMYDIVSR